MKEILSTVTRKGQVTIPVEIRSAWDLKPRDKVVFEREGERVIIKPAPSRLLAGYGAVAPKQRPEDFAAIREATEKTVAQEVVGEG
ncbi:MAG: AbrB/MazE/SpoVT family DNA-binding domain-containing protein [Anaerolineae bacterium]